MRTLAALKDECRTLGLTVEMTGRQAKANCLEALRSHYWEADHPGKPLPEQIEPMLLKDWHSLDSDTQTTAEADDSDWMVQEKHDGVRVLVHIDRESVRITGRNISTTTYRLSEYAEHVPHLKKGLDRLYGTVLDAELICPLDAFDTGTVKTTSALQAVVAVLATSPDSAVHLQAANDSPIQAHVFDVLRDCGENLKDKPLSVRHGRLLRLFAKIDNPNYHVVNTVCEDKVAFHESVIERGGEGTVWKRADSRYRTGKRSSDWIKRKRSLRFDGVISGFKPGTTGRGNEHLVGAIEVSDPSGRPIAWISNLTDEERVRLTDSGQTSPRLLPEIYGRRITVEGHDIAGRSGRLRHARIVGRLI